MKKILIALINFYRKCISPGKAPCCRYIPTCSQYALQALEKHGALKGTWLAIKRIARCNPFHKWDYDPYDPVPETYVPKISYLKIKHRQADAQNSKSSNY